MAADSFYRKTFNIEFNYPKRNPDFLLISDANWVGGFPWYGFFQGNVTNTVLARIRSKQVLIVSS